MSYFESNTENHWEKQASSRYDMNVCVHTLRIRKIP
jgi:hypothetical protein